MNCPNRVQILEVINGVSDAAAPHIQACADCAKIYSEMMTVTEVLARTKPTPVGACLSDEQLTRYATRTIHPEMEARVEEHLATCTKCLDEVSSLAEALEAPAGEVPANLRSRVLAAGGVRASGSHRVPSTFRGRARKTGSSWGWWVAAAAALMLALVALAVRNPERPKTEPVKVADKKQEPPLKKDEEPPPKKEEPKKEEVVQKEEPKKEEPKREEPKKEEVVKKEEQPKKEEPKKEEPKKKEEPVVRQEEPPSKVEETKYKSVVLASIRGDLYKGTDKLVGRAEVAREEVLATDERWKAAFSINEEARVWMKEGTTLRVEQTEAGDVLVVVDKGEAYFEVDKRSKAFVVRAPHADAIVVGTKFGVKIRKTDSTLLVLEGQVKFKNPKGEVTVAEGQKSTATSTARPTTPSRIDVAAEVAWTSKGDIAKEPAKEPYMEDVPGSNPKFPGLVIVSPYAEWEGDSGRIARVTSDRMESGLVLGHGHRDKKDKKIWINIDRGTEGKVADDGSLGQAETTKRAQDYYAEYMKHVRAASGVKTGQIPLIVTFRDHSETVAGTGEELAVCEVAYNGIDRKTIKQLKAYWDELIATHKPAYTLVLKFDEVDDTYEFAGQRISFKFTESDAKNQGYMQHARKAITIFFNPSFGKNPQDFEAYSKILAKMIEFVYTR